MQRDIKQLGLVLLLILTVLSQSTLTSQEASIREQRVAVRIAERFVASRGYDKQLKPNEPSVCWDQSEEAVESGRSRCSKSIMSKAVKAFIVDENGKAYWSVQFLFRQQPAKRKYDYGREVRVSLNGRKIWIEQKVVRVWKHLPPE